VVRQAAAVLKEAKLTHDRMKELSRRDLVSRAELDAAVSQLTVAEARYQDALEEVRNRQGMLAQRRSELELARQQLDDTVLRAPVDGMIRERRAAVGEYLAAGAPIATLVRVHPLRLVLAVPERAAAGIRTGQDVQVTVDGDTTIYRGRVARLSPSIQEQNRTLTVEAEVPNQQGRLRPGAFAKADIVLAADQPAVFVPASAIVVFAGIEKVLTIKDGKSVELRVETGRRENSRVEIVKGVKAGQPIVAEPGNLVGGQAVSVVQ
jgi:RND family efflux transporter MFP subunit